MLGLQSRSMNQTAAELPNDIGVGCNQENGLHVPSTEGWNIEPN